MTDPIQQIEENLRSLVGRAMMTSGKEGLIHALIAKDISNLLKLVKAYEKELEMELGSDTFNHTSKEYKKEIFEGTK